MRKGMSIVTISQSLRSNAHRDSVHNLSVANHTMHDPSLTPFGEEQCRQLAQSFPKHDSIDLLVCSPLRRTIYTALLGFKQDIERCGPVIALPEAQETADVPCDTGTDLPVLKKEMADKPVDLNRLTEGWNTKVGRWAPTGTAVSQRAKEARQWLKARPEKEIVLVTHGGFVHYFTEDWSGYVEARGGAHSTLTPSVADLLLRHGMGERRIPVLSIS